MTGASLGYSGHYADTSLDYVGSNGYWWSSTIGENSSSYLANVGTNGMVRIQYNVAKRVGRAVRCLPNPGPTYSLPMGMGIMRVGVRMLEAIHYHMSIQATTTGVLVCFTTRR